MVMASPLIGGSVSVNPVSRCVAVSGVDGNLDWNSQHGLEVVVASGMLLNNALSGGSSVRYSNPGERDCWCESSV